MNIRTANLKTLTPQRGLTLVELMVSLVLSLVLMLGAMQLFTGSKQTYQLSDALARVQENGRYALDLLARDIRQAGFTGCIATPEFSNLLNVEPKPWQFDFERPIFGYEADNGETSPSAASSGSAGEAWANSDAIVVLFGDPGQVFPVTGPASPSPSAPLEIAPGTAFNEGRAFIVTDCSFAALFRLSADKSAGGAQLAHGTGAGSPDNCSSYLHDSCVNSGTPGVLVASGVDPAVLRPYSPDFSQVLPLAARGYFIGNTLRNDSAGNPVPALYRQRFDEDGDLRPIEELVEGVQNLEILYGVASTNSRSAEKFWSADAVTAADEWAQVMAVRVELTVQSVTDPALSRNFSTTVAIRNRTL